jgi:transcriptional regulator with XRE-family HTH domain
VDADEINKAIGRRLRIRRQILGLTQTDIGNRIGVSFQQVQKYERGTNRISATMLCEISNVLETNLDYFLGKGAGTTKGHVALQPAKDPVAGADDIEEVLSTELQKEQLLLLRYFRLIQDPNVRQRILGLIQSLAVLEKVHD